MSYVLHRKQSVPRPRDEVFAFFTDAANLALLSPDFVGFEMLTPLPVPFDAGTVLEYRLRLWGMPVRWATRIESVERSRRFVDVELRGPYRLWRHTHEFADVPGGTEVTDHVEYALPFGPLGAVAHALFVRRTLERIFDYRRERLAALLSPEAPAPR